MSNETNWLTYAPDFGSLNTPIFSYTPAFETSGGSLDTSPSWGSSVTDWLTSLPSKYDNYGYEITSVKDPLSYYRTDDTISLTGSNAGENYFDPNYISDFFKNIPNAASYDLSTSAIQDYLNSPSKMTMLGSGLDAVNKALQVANTAKKATSQTNTNELYKQLIDRELQRRLNTQQLQASPVGQALSGAELAGLLYQAATKKDGIARSQFERNDSQSGAGPNFAAAQAVRKQRGYANGGLISITKTLYDQAKHSGLIPGDDDGQDDVVDIKAAPGEYVIDAETVSHLGDGNTEAGAKKLDDMRMAIRKHKRSGALSTIAPKARSVEFYIKG